MLGGDEVVRIETVIRFGDGNDDVLMREEAEREIKPLTPGAKGWTFGRWVREGESLHFVPNEEGQPGGS